MTIHQPLLPGTTWGETEDQPFLGDEFRVETRSDYPESKEEEEKEVKAKGDQD